MNTKHILLTGLVMIGLVGTGWAQGNGPRLTRQDDKNAMRNLGAGLGAAAVGSAVRGRVGEAIVLGAGAAYTGKKYEDARKAQRDEDRFGRDSRDGRYNTDAYDRDRFQTPSRWERERIERERRECEERERRERILRERLERERRGRVWERDCRDRDHRRG